MEDGGRYLQQIEEARTGLGRVHNALLKPDASVWEYCTPELDRTVSTLSAVEKRLREDAGLSLEMRAEVRKQLQGLRRDADRVNRLMESAANSYLGWAQMLAVAVNGYSSEGRIPALTARGGLSLQA